MGIRKRLSPRWHRRCRLAIVASVGPYPLYSSAFRRSKNRCCSSVDNTSPPVVTLLRWVQRSTPGSSKNNRRTERTRQKAVIRSRAVTCARYRISRCSPGSGMTRCAPTPKGSKISHSETSKLKEAFCKRRSEAVIGKDAKAAVGVLQRPATDGQVASPVDSEHNRAIRPVASGVPLTQMRNPIRP
jgi:hypothetical protein